jgi:NAD+ dependent glucose-6-phosphate dehydrogenase
MKRVLVTGLSGLIGGAVHRRLAGRYELTALNRRDAPGVRCIQADVADFSAIRPAFDGQDVVVHLAAVVRGNATWDELLHANVIGVYNVFEAARQAGVERVIFASSGSVFGGYAQRPPYNALLEGRYDDVPPSWPMLSHESLPHPAVASFGVRHWPAILPTPAICL